MPRADDLEIASQIWFGHRKLCNKCSTVNLLNTATLGNACLLGATYMKSFLYLRAHLASKRVKA